MHQPKPMLISTRSIEIHGSPPSVLQLLHPNQCLRLSTGILGPTRDACHIGGCHLGEIRVEGGTTTALRRPRTRTSRGIAWTARGPSVGRERRGFIIIVRIGIIHSLLQLSVRSLRQNVHSMHGFHLPDPGVDVVRRLKEPTVVLRDGDAGHLALQVSLLLPQLCRGIMSHDFIRDSS